MLKDTVLDSLPVLSNVAQFVSFAPNGNIRYNRIRGYKPNYDFSREGNDVVNVIIDKLFKTSSCGALNIRTFRDKESKSGPFLYEIRSKESLKLAISNFQVRGYYVIVHETIDVNDGGISGVCMGGMMEFSPGKTPRCVEGPDVCRLPIDIGFRLLEMVYGFQPYFGLSEINKEDRIEFSIHPKKLGYLNNQTIVWEIESNVGSDLKMSRKDITWPNAFSKMLGDKVYGLLIANLFGFLVPETTVINRYVAPFIFGRDTNTREHWIRSCPRIPEPGYYPTEFGWTDPFKMMNFCDKNEDVSSVESIVSQKAINAVYSGSASISGVDIIVEGVAGRGDQFMVGKDPSIYLPKPVSEFVESIMTQLECILGNVSIEWVYGHGYVWIVQLHKLKSSGFSNGDVIVPGNVSSYLEFDVSLGLDKLRECISNMSKVYNKDKGICLMGDIGILSHFGDLLRKSKIPSKIIRG